MTTIAISMMRSLSGFEAGHFHVQPDEVILVPSHNRPALSVKARFYAVACPAQRAAPFPARIAGGSSLTLPFTPSASIRP